MLVVRCWLIGALILRTHHSLFWKNLAPAADQRKGHAVLQPGSLQEAIDRDFGGLANLQADFNAQTAAIQRSGWGWLVSCSSGR